MYLCTCFYIVNFIMNLSSTDLAKRRSAGFISVKDMEGNDIYVNLDMIVNVVKKNQYCILNHST